MYAVFGHRGGAVLMADRRGVSLLWSAALVGALSVLLFCWYWRGFMVDRPDFDQVYLGALALRGGLNPYDVVGPVGKYHWPMPLYYPMPALVVAIPFTLLPIRLAGAVFIGLGGALLGYALALDAEETGTRWRYVLLMSESYIYCVAQGQFSLLFLAAALVPRLNVFAAIKPNVGAVAMVRARSWGDLRWPVIVGVLLIVVSFAVRPSWVGEWRRALADAPYQHAPIATPLGFLALAVLVRWRRADARYALAFAMIPQTPGRYTDLLLFAIPRGKWQTVSLALLSFAVVPLYGLLPRLPTLPERIGRHGAVSTAILLLPCVIMILRRPNTTAP